MNVKTAEPIGSIFFVPTNKTQGGFMDGHNLENYLPENRIFQNSRGKV